MSTSTNYDFSGWATRNNIRCSDGLTIRRDAFKDNNNGRVPLVWQHQHNDPENVLGYAVLENRPDGVYAYGKFNDNPRAQAARESVRHGDITSLSIYANKLTKRGADVIHGVIREVSLVFAGANPGAYIDSPVLAHSDDCDIDNFSAVIYSGEEEFSVFHADSEKENNEMAKDNGELTVQDIWDGMTEEEQNVCNFLVEQAVAEATGSMKHSDDDFDDDSTVEEVLDSMTPTQREVVEYLVSQAVADAEEDMQHSMEDYNMHYNMFEQNGVEEPAALSHEEVQAIFADARQCGSLRQAVIAHGMEDINVISHGYADEYSEKYGIGNIGYLFPDATNLNKTPEFINADDAWVSVVMSGTRHTPFSRVKSVFADITEDDARAKGYIKGKLKKEEVFGLLKRVTTPTTVYKKQKLDRDDIVDITDFDVVAWLKGEMQVKLKEELARAFLFGDGRSIGSDDKIQETCIRPVWTDSDLFTVKSPVTFASAATADEKCKQIIRAIIKSRKSYKGSGNPVMFCSEDLLSDMLLMTDANGRDLYDSEEKLRAKLRVSRIVTVPMMEGLSRTDSTDNKTHALLALLVDLSAYNVGTDKGGAQNMMDDFDIDYNQYKYLIETRCSGALVKPFSAIAVEEVPAA